jgi:hypothetical protein
MTPHHLKFLNRENHISGFVGKMQLCITDVGYHKLIVIIKIINYYN